MLHESRIYASIPKNMGNFEQQGLIFHESFHIQNVRNLVHLLLNSISILPIST